MANQPININTTQLTKIISAVYNIDIPRSADVNHLRKYINYIIRKYSPDTATISKLFYESSDIVDRFADTKSSTDENVEIGRFKKTNINFSEIDHLAQATRGVMYSENYVRGLYQMSIALYDLSDAFKTPR